MKSLVNMISFEFRRIAPYVYAICGGLLVVQLISFLFCRTKIELQYCNFEVLLELSNYPLIFLFAFITVLMVNCFSFSQNYFGSKSIYTLMSLPSNRNNIYISKMISGLIAVLFVVVVQIFGVFLTYRIYLVGQTYLPIQNGLFMVFMRTKFLRSIMPFDFISFLVMIICAVSLVAATLHVFICIKRSSLINMAIVSIIVLWTTQTINNDRMELFNDLTHLIIVLGLLLLTLIYMIAYSLESINKGRIL